MLLRSWIGGCGLDPGQLRAEAEDRVGGMLSRPVPSVDIRVFNRHAFHAQRLARSRPRRAARTATSCCRISPGAVGATASRGAMAGGLHVDLGDSGDLGDSYSEGEES